MTTRVINTHEAKSRLSELIREAEAGREVIVARNGKPVAKIIPWPPAHAPRVPGAWKGSVSYAGDVVGPDPEVEALFGEGVEERVR